MIIKNVRMARFFGEVEKNGRKSFWDFFGVFEGEKIWGIFGSLWGMGNFGDLCWVLGRFVEFVCKLRFFQVSKFDAPVGKVSERWEFLEDKKFCGF
jgi:hypothetical protein